MKKQLFYAAMTFALALIAAPSAIAQTQFNSCAENEGADIAVNLPTSFTTSNANLPDPFMMLSGSRMTAKDQWKQRRQELLKLLEKTVYGAKPGKPASVTGTVSKTSISVKVGSASFSVAVTMPSSGSAPYPLVIRYDDSGAPTTDFTGNGIAVANYTTSSVGGGTRASKSGAFYTANPNNKTTGHLAAWAWGVSRIIDVIEADPDKLFDPTKIGVTGCSRDGKGAFAAGVLDQRVALTMPMESGTGGMASMRVAYNNRDQSGGSNGSQSPSSAYGEQPWLGDDFSAFQNSPDKLPIDMHEAIALVAPRGFLAIYKTAGSAGQWLNVPGSHVSAVSGAEVYKALGYGGNFGWMNTGTQSHCAWPSGYSTTVKDFCDKYLHRKKAPAAAPLFDENNRPAAAASMVNWTTPTLSGTLAVGCGPAPVVTGCALTTTVSPSSGGSVTASPAPNANGRYDTAAVVTLTAVAAAGWAFESWDGDASGAANPVAVTMNAGKSVTAKFKLVGDGTENLVKNGAFNGTTNWTLNQGTNYGGSAATVSASGGKATINITTAGTEKYQPQLVQTGIALEQGMKYRLTFKASAAAARTMEVLIQLAGSPYTSYAKGDFDLTAGEQTYKLEFEMTAASDPGAQLAFNVGGNSTQNVTISDVKLIYIAELGGNTGIAAKTPAASGAKPVLSVRTVSGSAISVNFKAVRGGEAELRLYGLKGGLIAAARLQTVTGGSYSHTFNVGKLPNGLYVAGLYSDGRLVEQARVAARR